MKVRIEIDTKTFVRFWLVVIGFGFVIFSLYSARAALMLLGTAFFLALALNGPVSRLAELLPGRSRSLSTALAFTMIVLILGTVVVLVIPPVVQQTAKFIDNVPTLVASVSQQWRGLGDIIEKYHLQPQIDQAVVSLQNDAARWATGLGRNFITGVGSVVSMFATSLLVLVLTFLMLVEGPLWLERLMGLYRNASRRDAHRRVISRMRGVVSGYVTGQLAVSGIDGLAAGAVIFLLSLVFHEVPANLSMVAIAVCFTLSMIPLFGATLAGIIMTILLALNSIPAAVVFVVYFMIYQQIENNVVSPAIQSRRIDLSPLAVLVAVTIGLYVFGIVGGIVSIPIAGCIKVLADEYLKNAKKARTENEKPLTKLAKKLAGDQA